MKHSFSNELYKTASCMPTPAISRCLLSYEYGPFSKGPKVMTNGNSKTFQKKIDSKDCFTLGAGKAGTKHDPNWCCWWKLRSHPCRSSASRASLAGGVRGGGILIKRRLTGSGSCAGTRCSPWAPPGAGSTAARSRPAPRSWPGSRSGSGRRPQRRASSRSASAPAPSPLNTCPRPVYKRTQGRGVNMRNNEQNSGDFRAGLQVDQGPAANAHVGAGGNRARGPIRCGRLW